MEVISAGRQDGKAEEVTRNELLCRQVCEDLELKGRERGKERKNIQKKQKQQGSMPQGGEAQYGKCEAK